VTGLKKMPPGNGRDVKRRWAVLAVGIALVVSGCVSPAINAEGYRGKVSQSAKKMVGLVNTARLAVRLDLGGRMLHTVTDTVVTDAERDAESVLTSLDSVQPPDQGSIKLRSDADDVLQQASSQLADLRIAVRRRDQAGMRSGLNDLGKTLADVQHLQDTT
jgi:hypothetical protein